VQRRVSNGLISGGTATEPEKRVLGAAAMQTNETMHGKKSCLGHFNRMTASGRETCSRDIAYLAKEAVLLLVDENKQPKPLVFSETAVTMLVFLPKWK